VGIRFGGIYIASQGLPWARVKNSPEDRSLRGAMELKPKSKISIGVVVGKWWLTVSLTIRLVVSDHLKGVRPSRSTLEQRSAAEMGLAKLLPAKAASGMA